MHAFWTWLSQIPWNSMEVMLKEVNLVSTFTRLFLAAIFGGLIGMERGRRRRAAGLRTHMLVCIGAALVMITNQYVSGEFGLGDPTRLGAQVINGIGFLGVGTIIVDRQQQVRGLTTAAGLWACACMGLAFGIGFYSGAIIACLFLISTITVLNKLEPHIINRSRFLEIYVEFDDQNDIRLFLHGLAEGGIKIDNLESVQPRNATDKDDPGVALIATLQLPRKLQHAKVLESLENIEGMRVIEEVK